MEYYFDSTFANLVNMFKTLSGNTDINISVEYDNIPLNYTDNIYNINANFIGYSVNIIDILFSIYC